MNNDDHNQSFLPSPANAHEPPSKDGGSVVFAGPSVEELLAYGRAISVASEERRLRERWLWSGTKWNPQFTRENKMPSFEVVVEKPA